MSNVTKNDDNADKNSNKMKLMNAQRHYNRRSCFQL